MASADIRASGDTVDCPPSPSSTVEDPTMYDGWLSAQRQYPVESARDKLAELGYSDTELEALLQQHNFTCVRIAHGDDFFQSLLDSVRPDLPLGLRPRHDPDFTTQWEEQHRERRRKHEYRIFEILPQLIHYSNAFTTAQTDCDALWNLSEAVSDLFKSLPTPIPVHDSSITIEETRTVPKRIGRLSKVCKTPPRRSRRLQEQSKSKKLTASKPAQKTGPSTKRIRRRR